MSISYTIMPGDTYSTIATAVGACRGLTYQQITAANPGVNPSALQVGQVINIPSATTGAVVLRYTVRSGDSYSTIAANLSNCAGVSVQQITEANPGVNPSGLQVGQVITIPDAVAPKPVPAPNIGYWCKNWSVSTPPAGATMGMAFTGWADPASAIRDSAGVQAGLIGTKFITLGGGNDSGKFTADTLTSVANGISTGMFAGYGGIAFDIEEGDAGLTQAFQTCFAKAKAAGFKVLVTVSHSAPYGVTDAAQLMTAIFADANVDFLSPQLYTQGTETANDYTLTAGVDVTWNLYAQAKAAIVPSVVGPQLYTDAQTYFAGQGVTLAGYISWG